MQKNAKMPSAIVLSKAVTGLATVRGIAHGGVDVSAAIFNANDPVKFSSHCHKIDLSTQHTERELLDWLLSYVRGLENRPVVIPTSDELALMLARNHDILTPYCRLWRTSHDDLSRIINKNDLYRLAEAAGVKTVPALVEPSLDQTIKWSMSNPGPYFLKPFYEGIADCKLREKNLLLSTADELVSYISSNGATALVVQRFIQGGDGYIFDSYGLCNEQGEIVTIASHRRWRQHPPGTGTTSFGEIPANPEGKDESVLFENTSLIPGNKISRNIWHRMATRQRNRGALYH